MKRSHLLTILALLLAVGCDDSSKGSGDPNGGGADAAPGADVGPGGGDGDTGPNDRPDAAPPRADAAPGPEPAYIEVALDPRRGLYMLDETPQVVVQVFDRIGRPLDGVDVRLDVQPAEQGVVTPDGVLTFAAEGQGAVRACYRANLCGRASFFVDDGRADLEITSPQRGALITGEPTIAIEGRTDAGGEVAVFINDRPVEVAEDGTFSHAIDATFGLNRIDAIADDGVRRPPTRVVMEVVYAPTLLEPTPTEVLVPGALAVRLDQRLLDSRQPLPPPDEMGVQRLTDLAMMIEGFLSRAEPLGLIGDPVIADDDTLQLTVESITPGTPDATITVTDGGFEVFLRLEDLTLTTTGSLEIEGVPVGLNGQVMVTAAAFVVVGVEPGPDGFPGLRIVDVGVALEDLSGVMDDSTAQAVLDTFGSLLRTVLQSFASDLVDDLISESVPDFIELGLGDALGVLRGVPLDVPLGDGLPTIALDLDFTLSDPTARARDAVWLGLAGAIRQRGPVEAPHPFAGVPVEDGDATPPWPAQTGLALAVNLATVNALLHEVWRQGALKLDLAPVLPDDVAGLIAEARADARVPPLVVAAPPGSPYFFELQIGELDLYAKGPAGDAPDRFVLSMRAGLILEVGEGGIRFDIADEPDVRVALLEQAGARPVVPPELIERLIPTLAWPQVREQIGNGLELAIDPIEIGVDAFAELAPSIQRIGVKPTFPTSPVVQRGWFVLSAGFEVELE